jgi:hypothetical protein
MNAFYWLKPYIKETLTYFTLATYKADEDRTG